MGELRANHAPRVLAEEPSMKDPESLKKMHTVHHDPISYTWPLQKIIGPRHLQNPGYGPVQTAAIIYTVFQKKTWHYIFDDNLNRNCPIAIIFGTLITQIISLLDKSTDNKSEW